jgi:hypothetical protein
MYNLVEQANPMLSGPVITSTADQRTIHVSLILVPVVIAVFQIIFMYLAYKLYIEFGWKIYKKIGADPYMRSIFLFSH